MPRITPAFAPPTHLAPLVAVLERIAAGERVRAVVSVPPRHGKTELLLHALAWLLARHPGWLLAYVSYAADFARSKSRQARDYALAAGVALRADSAALHEWRATGGGGLLATGVGGPLTGHGVKLLAVDDPFKNRSEADSPAIRHKVFEWFRSTAITRVEPGASALIVHTRWHRDDLIGRVLRSEELREAGPWENVLLPAIGPTGAALWPERWPLAELALRRLEVGEQEWEAQFEQNPVQRRGLVWPQFRRAVHVVPHARIEAQFRVRGRWTFRRTVVGVDFGWNHPGVALVVAQTGTGDCYVLEEEVHRGVTVALVSDGRPGWLAIYRRLRNEYRPEAFCADPSEPGNITQMRGPDCLDGDPVVYGANNDVADGIRRVATLLEPHPATKRPRLYVSDRCPRLIECIETWSYAHRGGESSETPTDTGDDPADALRYAAAALVS